MPKTKIPTKLKYEILKRDNYRCLWCGRDIADGIKLNIDHVIPESFGGPTNYENLGVLCNECNNGKSNEYVGNYLLTTRLKIPNFEKKIKFEELGPAELRDAKACMYLLEFYKSQQLNQYYSLVRFKHIFHIPNQWLAYPDEDCKIRIDLENRKNLLLFKEKLRDFLIKNKGYLEELNGRILFKEYKQE